MKKIKTVFVIDRSRHRVTDVVFADWVLAGEGVATVKYDGTSVKSEKGVLYKRYDAKHAWRGDGRAAANKGSGADMPPTDINRAKHKLCKILICAQ